MRVEAIVSGAAQAQRCHASLAALAQRCAGCAARTLSYGLKDSKSLVSLRVRALATFASTLGRMRAAGVPGRG